MTIDWKSRKIQIIAVLFFILFSFAVKSIVHYLYFVKVPPELAKSGSCWQLRDADPPVWEREECWRVVCTGHRFNPCSRRWKTAEELEEDATLPQIKADAEQGDAAAQLRLGKYYSRIASEAYGYESFQEYQNGTMNFNPPETHLSKVPQILEESAKWYRKAAEQGNAEAQNYLGGAYWYGLGVQDDNEEAVRWYKKAAEQGNLNAQLQLRYIYDGVLGGRTIKVDHEEAAKWLEKAKENGYVAGGVPQ
ncbi:MAG: sel1 repeat family protein [Alphaproteobacteria bacterium]|nr:MAG: sel1 repeat family protein [Alphaproteobacteria bacterium]